MRLDFWNGALGKLGSLCLGSEDTPVHFFSIQLLKFTFVNRIFITRVQLGGQLNKASPDKLIPFTFLLL